MSKKDYIAIAREFNIQLALHADSKPACTALREIAQALAIQFKQDNPRFDRERFLIACGF